MGYPKRLTGGYINCRPKEFDSDIFLKPNILCDEECPYYIFCMTELNKKTLGDRVKELRLSFQRPYHVFSIMENGDVFLVFESEKGERLSFREKTLIGATKKAEDYLTAMKIRSGQETKLREQQLAKDGVHGVSTSKTPSATSETPPTAFDIPIPSEDDDSIEIKSTIIDSGGNKRKE